MITVDALVGRPDLDLTLLAGTDGGDRMVAWAHAVDLPDPWRWVHPGDLVMTTGAGLPQPPAEQVEWMTRLVGSRASGLVYAPRPGAPALSHEALAVAHDSRFPVLGAGFDLEFTHLAHVVIESALDTQRHRLARSERLFAVYASALRDGGSLDDRLRLLGSRFGWELEVALTPIGTADASSAPADPGSGELAMTVPGRAPATLIVRQLDPSNMDNVPDPILVNYLVGLLGIELEREAIERDRLRGTGEALLRRILDGSVDFATARDAMEERGLTGSVVTVVLHPSGTPTWPAERAHHLPALSGVHPLLLPDGDQLLAVLPDRELLLEEFRAVLGDASSAGISSPINATTGLVESVRQARLALAQARDSDVLEARYAATRAVSLLPDTVAETRELAQRHLGPLIEHDASNGTELVATVAAFLAADGSWKRTAEQLHVHRQTLVYRLKTVEQLTGLKPTSTVGTARLWLALEAGRSVGLIS